MTQAGFAKQLEGSRHYGINLECLIRVSRAVVLKQEKGTKTKSGLRDVLLLPAALEAVKHQKAYTYLEGKRVFYNPRTNTPWETDGQIRKTS